MGPGAAEINLLLAFSAGLLSFVSPCILPLLPGYLTFITGLSFEDVSAPEITARVRRTSLIHAALFIAGFSTIFIVLGLSVTALGRLAAAYQDLIRRAGGVIIVLLGLHVAGLLPTAFLLKEKRVTLRDKPAGLVGSFIVGLAFAAGWTPCVGPILASILIYAGTKTHLTQGFFLLLAYTLGLGVPFFLSALALNRFLLFFQRFKKWMPWVGPVSGLFLVGMGLLLFFDLLGRLAPGPAL